MRLYPGALWERICVRKRADFIVNRVSTESYLSLRSCIEAFCVSFDEYKLSPGDKVLIVVRDDFLASAAFLASLLDGLVPVMLSPDSSSDRIQRVAESLDAKVLLSVKPNVISHCEHLRIDLLWQNVNVSAHRAFFRFMSRLDRGNLASARKMSNARPPRCAPVKEDQLAYILFTSGTTSKPSGIEITQSNLFSHLETLIRVFDYNDGSRIFNPTPLAHTDGLVQGPLLAAAVGAALVRPGPYQVAGMEEWLDFVRASRSSHIITNPTILTLINRFAKSNDYFDAPEFRGILSTAAILRPDLWEKFEARFKTTIWNVYGMTETVANALYAGRHPEMGALGTIGRPIDCKARIGDAEGQPLLSPDEVEGELQLAGPNIFRGYWKNPESTRDTITADGWMRTGDIVRRLADGSYTNLHNS